METPVTVDAVESFQEEIQSEISEQNGWEVYNADPSDAVNREELSVLNMYKNGGNDGEVNVIVDVSGGVFYVFEYLDSDTVADIVEVDELIDHLQTIIDDN